MPEFLDGVVEHVDRIKALINIDRPLFCFVNFNKCEEYVNFVTSRSFDTSPEFWMNLQAMHELTKTRRKSRSRRARCSTANCPILDVNRAPDIEPLLFVTKPL